MPVLARAGRAKLCSSFGIYTCESQCDDANPSGNETVPANDSESGDGESSEDSSGTGDDADFSHFTVEPEKTCGAEQEQDEAKLLYIASLCQVI